MAENTVTADRETELLDRVPDKLFIGGEWRNATDDKQLRVFEELREVERGERRELGGLDDDGAARGERRSDLSCRHRQWKVPRRDQEAGTDRMLRDDHATGALGVRSVTPLDASRLLAEPAQELAAVRITGRYGLNPEGTGRMIVSQRPVGPSFFITPWNFPLAMATRKIAPALAAGCTVVVKPAALTPLTTIAFVQLLEEVGLPKGVVNVVTTSKSSALSAPIIADPRLRKLSFTGSTEVGRKLLEQSALGILRTSMELGGNAPFVIFEDADLDKAVDGAMIAKFRNIGQACTAANRFIVHESVADEFAKRVADRVRAMKVGRGTEDGVNIGPLIDQDAVDSTDALVQDAVGRGATVLTGGTRIDGDGTFYAPTVLAGVAAGSRLLKEEIFGPVLGITTFADEDEAVRLANGTEYGLVSYVFTQDLARGHRLIDRLATGMMGLNTGLVSNAAAPFGGVKASGIGREGGLEGIEEFLETKYIAMAM